MPARSTALRAMMICRQRDGWSDPVLKEEIQKAGLSGRDAALATTLFYGTLQNQALLDYRIDSLLTGRKHLKPVLRDILRLGAYQILFLDRVPPSAAVNEAVKQAKARCSQREASLCNGLLRNLIRQKDSLETPKDFSVLYSHPAELVDLIKASVGKHLEAILRADNESPETSILTNTLKTDPETLRETLLASGVSVTPHPWLSGCFLLKGTGDLEGQSAFQQGLFQVQDAAARLAVEVLEPKPGMRALDLCAAPGGKSMALAMRMENRGEIISCDIYPGKLKEVERAAARLGVSIVTTVENDAAVFRPEWEASFDLVLADVPCSGLGVIRKKPDIRYKDLSGLEALPALQSRILEQAGRYVRPGGTLLYSTCTILRRENEAVAEQFLACHPEFSPVELQLPQPLQSQRPGMLSLYQGVHDCDGFFLSVMRKKQ